MEPMTLGKYMERLKIIRDTYGPHLILVSSSDDEGNSFGEVYYAPTPGIFVDGEFEDDAKKPTHLCVN
jgi:hypothetical protein